MHPAGSFTLLSCISSSLAHLQYADRELCNLSARMLIAQQAGRTWAVHSCQTLRLVALGAFWRAP